MGAMTIYKYRGAQSWVSVSLFSVVGASSFFLSIETIPVPAPTLELETSAGADFQTPIERFPLRLGRGG